MTSDTATSLSEAEKRNLWKHHWHLCQLCWMIEDLQAKPLSMRDQIALVDRIKKHAQLAAERFGKIESANVTMVDRAKFAAEHMGGIA